MDTALWLLENDRDSSVDIDNLFKLDLGKRHSGRFPVTDMRRNLDGVTFDIRERIYDNLLAFKNKVSIAIFARIRKFCREELKFTVANCNEFIEFWKENFRENEVSEIKEWKNETDIVFCCADCDMKIIRDSYDHKHAVKWDDELWMCEECYAKTDAEDDAEDA
jgi:hypothetical protein